MHGKDGRTSQTSRDATKPKVPIVSLIALTASLRICAVKKSDMFFRCYMENSTQTIMITFALTDGVM